MTFFKCPKCDSEVFEITFDTRDQVTYTAKINKDGTYNTEAFFQDYCGDMELAHHP